MIIIRMKENISVLMMMMISMKTFQNDDTGWGWRFFNDEDEEDDQKEDFNNHDDDEN